jgi:hypothetical protein
MYVKIKKVFKKTLGIENVERYNFVNPNLFYLHTFLDGLLADVGGPLGIVVFAKVIFDVISVSAVFTVFVVLAALALLFALAALLFALGQRSTGRLQILLWRILKFV